MKINKATYPTHSTFYFLMISLFCMRAGGCYSALFFYLPNYLPTLKTMSCVLFADSKENRMKKSSHLLTGSIF